MAQKDKIKELVGRGLGSYHTKALQQIDRIEKKNKEQNHKISILTNELDNDYLTKTEEGSVVSLEHSKEGMVYLDELQGNTLVNYCPDGAKELTLNGDIDVEGTNVTLTEGVDNGLVDVMCEGNTLVNLLSDVDVTKDIVSSPTNHIGDFYCNMLTEGKIYSIKWETDADIQSGYIAYVKKDGAEVSLVKDVNKHNFVKFTLPSNFENFRLYVSSSQAQRSKNFKALLLEGDWTDKKIPSYFEGMKSVAELEGNKIEILSQSKNLFDKNNSEFSRLYMPNTNVGYEGSFSQSNGLRSVTFKCRKNTDYTISKLNGYAFRVYGAKEKPVTGIVGKFLFANNGGLVTTINSEDYSYLQIVYYSYNNENKGEFTEQQVIDSLQIEYGKTQTSYTDYKLNKKEISLSEPLRALPNGVCDKVVKIGGKWYVERNCYQTKFNTTNFIINIPSSAFSNGYQGVYAKIKNQYTPINVSSIESSEYIICDKVSIVEGYINNIGDREGVCLWLDSTADIVGRFKVGTTDFNYDVTKQYIDNLDLTIVYQLATPIYEELPIDSTINTYNDITHISNNSTIPCNMKVTNTGYNAIIKPSTQYTVALDTNKSGTIGINLGGAKVTTTNNVATITTPATLTDDSLRLYGKGIKASKVRLLEGNKTNWIPSHFEGMKSSFEDKLQDDGTYKMEILSNNENLFNMGNFIKCSSDTFIETINNGLRLYNTKERTYASAYFSIKVKPNTTYKLYCNHNIRKGIFMTDIYDMSNKYFATPTVTGGFNSKNNTELTLRFYCTNHTSDIGDIDITNIRLVEGVNDIGNISHKSNKIQFSSIEPLRSVDKNIKDKLIFKDGKLIIERNCGKTLLDGTESWGRNLSEDNFSKNRIRVSGANEKMIGYKHKGKLCVSNITNSTNLSLDVDFMNLCGLYERALYAYMPRKILGLAPTDNDATSIKEKWLSWLRNNNIDVVYELEEPTYEEVPFELQKIILECYQDGTLFIDTNIPPTVTTTYSGETPIVKATRLNKTEVLNNTNDINDNIVPYLMDMDYRVVCLQLECGIENISMARLFGGTFEMLQRDILSNRYSKDEYKYRLDAYLSANKITENEYEKLGDMLND